MQETPEFSKSENYMKLAGSDSEFLIKEYV